MKVTINIDCTPEEARRFMGLPDLTPVHDVYVDKMRSAVSDAMTPELFAETVRQWGPMSEAGLDVWRQMIGQMGSLGGAKSG
jgi:hypothetical protein